MMRDLPPPGLYRRALAVMCDVVEGLRPACVGEFKEASTSRRSFFGERASSDRALIEVAVLRERSSGATCQACYRRQGSRSC
jgi:hypothetical protein